MPVFKPRNRLVNFRLSEEEFEKLRASCSLYGARSLSDFARAAVMRSVTGGGHTSPETADPTMDRKMNDLESRIGELSRLVESLRNSNYAPVHAGQGE